MSNFFYEDMDELDLLAREAEEQIRRDEEFARSLQEGEDAPSLVLDEDEALAKRLQEEEVLGDAPSLVWDEDEALAKRLQEEEEQRATLSPAAIGEEIVEDRDLCLKIQAQEEELQRKLREERDARAQAALLRELEAEEREMIARALREEDLKQFPVLQRTQNKTTTTEADRPQLKQVADQPEPSRHTSEIVDLLTREFPNIPSAFIEIAARDARGSLRAADTRILRMYPNEYMAQKQLDQQRAQRAAIEDTSSSSSSGGIKTEITILKGRKLQDIRANEQAPNAMSADTIRQNYLGLAERTEYTVADLQSAYEIWGGSQAAAAAAGSKAERYTDRTVMDEMNYHSARWDGRAIAEQIREDTRFLHLLGNVAEEDLNTRAALEKKIARAKRELRASELEAADMLFVRNNAQLLKLLTRKPQQQQGNASQEKEENPLQVDLHTMHVKEAIDRVHAVILFARRNDCLSIKLITGKGKHSANKEAKLKPELEAYLNSHLRDAIESWSAKPGHLLVELKTMYQS